MEENKAPYDSPQRGGADLKSERCKGGTPIRVKHGTHSPALCTSKAAIMAL